MASGEGRQRQQTVAAALLGVILTWFVLGQMAALNGLLARLSRFLFILRPQLAGKQQVMAQRHSSAIRRLLDEKESFSVLTSGISAQGVDVCLSVCLSVPVLQSRSRQWPCSLELGRGFRENISALSHQWSNLSLLN